MLEGFLHDSLKARIIHRFHGSPGADARDRKVLIEDALREHKTAHEIYAIDELADYKPIEEVVSGLDNVIKACNLFLIRKLVLNQALHRNAFVCRQHHVLSLESTRCPFCNAELLPVENVVDEIVEIARLHGVNITVVENRPDLLEQYQGIAALLYAPLSEP
jgi:peptide subunit release factor 1 (eRF1)